MPSAGQPTAAKEERGGPAGRGLERRQGFSLTMTTRNVKVSNKVPNELVSIIREAKLLSDARCLRLPPLFFVNLEMAWLEKCAFSL